MLQLTPHQITCACVRVCAYVCVCGCVRAYAPANNGPRKILADLLVACCGCAPCALSKYISPLSCHPRQGGSRPTADGASPPPPPPRSTRNKWACLSSELATFGEVFERERAKVVLGHLGAVLVRQHDAVGHVAQRLFDEPDRERGVVLADLVGVADTH